jgi:hypothetical protein
MYVIAGALHAPLETLWQLCIDPQPRTQKIGGMIQQATSYAGSTNHEQLTFVHFCMNIQIW